LKKVSAGHYMLFSKSKFKLVLDFLFSVQRVFRNQAKFLFWS